MNLRIVFALAALFCVGICPPAMAVSVGDALPELQATASQDVAVSQDTLRGKVVLVNFWASWCPPCRDELPELQKMHTAYQEQGFEVVGINIDTQRDNATEFIKRYNVTFPVLFDPQQSVIRQFGAKAMPTSYLVNRDGVIQQVFHGYSAQKRTRIEQAITALLATTSETAKLTVEEAR